MIRVELKNVTVDHPIYGAHNMNLKGRSLDLLRGKRQKIEHIRALENVSLQVKDGDRIGITGPNGVGKTTLLRVAAGILQPTSGEVRINGNVVSLIDQGMGFDPQCTGIENIFRRGIYLRQSAQHMRRHLSEIIEFSGLGPRIHHPIYTYSSGMITRLAVSIVVFVRSEILILDEGIGLADQEFNDRASFMIGQLIEQTGALIAASHNESVLKSYCNSTLRLDRVSQ
jgi:ABC-type polysaccharide/polyol phosphate transport system ATPase subunit